MTVVNPDSIAGITSVTSSGTTLEFYDVNGNKLNVSADLTGSFTVGTGATINSPTANAIDFETNGAERVRIDSNGNMALGTNSPNNYSNYTTFTVNGTTGGQIDVESNGTKFGDIYTQSNTFHIRNKQASGNGSLVFHTTSGGTSAEKLRITSGGKLLVGTTTEGSSGVDNLILYRNGNGGITIRNNSNQNGNIFFSRGTSGTDEYKGYIQYQHAQDVMVFGTSHTERLRITSAGSVGIGTNNPTVGNSAYPVVQVHGTSTNAYFKLTNTTTGVGSNDGVELSLSGSDAYLTNRESASIIFRTSGTERSRIDSGGKILAGTTSSRAVAGGYAKIQVEAASSEGISLTRTTNDAGASYFSFGKIRTGGSNSGRCVAGDNIGAISWNPSDGTDLNHASAEIQCLVASGIGGNDVPGDLVFKTNGGTTTTTERLRIDSNGKFCFGTYTNGYQNNDSVANFVNAASAGTENPLITLWNPTTVGDARAGIDFLTNAQSGTGRDGAFIRGSNDGVTAKAHIQFGTIKDETYAETVRIASDGRVLMGTTTAGSGSADDLTIGNSSDHGGITIRTPNNKWGSIHFADGTSGGEQYRGQVSYDHSNDRMRLYVAQGERLAIHSNGSTYFEASDSGTVHYRFNNGTSGGSAHTQVTIKSYANSGADPYIKFDAGGSDMVVGNHYGGTTNNELVLGPGSNATDVAGLKIKGNGDVFTGISPDDTLWDTTSQSGVYYRRSQGSFAMATPANTGYASWYINKNTGNGGSTDRRYIDFYMNSSHVGRIQENGAGGTSYGTSSDYRLKENVVSIADGIEKVKLLNPVRFNYKTQSEDKVNQGFIAHEAQPIVPHAVTGEKDAVKVNEKGVEAPDYQDIDYGQLTPILTAALKDLIAKVETLEAEASNDRDYEAKIDKLIDYFKL